MISVFLGMIIIMNIRWVMFGMSIMWQKFKNKGNIGLMFLRSKANNFTVPYVVNLGEKEHQVKIGKKKHLYPIEREAYGKQGLFFGIPYVFYNDEDCKTSLGLVYHVADDDGVPQYHDGDVTKPIYSEIKNAVTLSGAFLQALVDEKVFSDALKEFMDKNQMLLYLCMGAIAAGGISAYFGYEMFSNLIPTFQDQVLNGFASINNKLDLILEAIK